MLNKKDPCSQITLRKALSEQCYFLHPLTFWLYLRHWVWYSIFISKRQITVIYKMKYIVDPIWAICQLNKNFIKIIIKFKWITKCSKSTRQSMHVKLNWSETKENLKLKYWKFSSIRKISRKWRNNLTLFPMGGIWPPPWEKLPSNSKLVRAEGPGFWDFYFNLV